MTLQQAVTHGITQNPEYGTAAQDTYAAKEVLFQAKGLNLPSIDLGTELGPEYTDSPFVDKQYLMHSRASLTLSQLLFDGLGTKSQIDKQKSRLESAVNHAGEVAENAGMDTVEAYLNVLRQRELLNTSRNNVQEHLKILDMIEAGAKAGTVTQGDVAQVQARTAQARATVASAEENLRRAESAFALKTGEMPGELGLPEVPSGKLADNVEDAVHLALTYNPTLAVATSDIKSFEADELGAKSLIYPRVDLQANMSVGDNLSGVPGNEQRRSVMTVLKWNLYRGGADRARARETLYRTASAKQRRLVTMRQVEKQTRDTWAAMLAAADRTRQYQDQAKANEKVVSVYLDQFTINRRSLLDVLDAQNELFISRSNALNSAFAEKFAVYQLLALEGRLLNTLGIAKPREAMLQQK